jgi:DNA-binding transcriptional LysR family regulator
LEIRSLRAFVTVAEELHFGRAAKRLALSQPSLTQQIKQLEANVGNRLFVRSNRSVSLTDHGARLLDEARAIVMRADGLLQVALRSRLGQEVGQLHVGFLAAAMFGPARSFYLRLLNNFPQIVPILYEMNTTEQIEGLVKGTLDIGILHQPSGDTTLRLQRLVREDCVIALPGDHPLAKSTKIALKQLRGATFVLPPRHMAPGLYDRIISACIEAGFSPSISHNTRHIATALPLVATGAGVTLVPESMTKIRLEGVEFRAIRGKSPSAEMFAAWNKKNRSPLLRAALQQLTAAV